MTLTGVLINSAGVFFAGILGSIFRKGIPDKVKTTLMYGLGLCVLFIGVTGLSPDMSVIVLVLSVAIGSVIGELIDIDKQLGQFGAFVQNKLKSSEDSISDGFISATLFVCVGAMSIVGGIESGTQGTYDTFLAKTFIDSIVVFVMAATKGVGCSLFAVVAFVYQTLLTVSADFISRIVNQRVIDQMSCVGSLLIIGIALNLLNVTKLKIANYIISPFMPVVIMEIIKIPPLISPMS